MNKLYRDQYGHNFFAPSVRALRKQIKNGSSTVSKMYIDDGKGETFHVGYVIGGHWLQVYTPMRKPVNELHAAFTVYAGHVAFRLSDGRTGSNPGRNSKAIIRAFLAQFKPGSHEILDNSAEIV